MRCEQEPVLEVVHARIALMNSNLMEVEVDYTHQDFEVDDMGIDRVFDVRVLYKTTLKREDLVVSASHIYFMGAPGKRLDPPGESRPTLELLTARWVCYLHMSEEERDKIYLRIRNWIMNGHVNR